MVVEKIELIEKEYFANHNNMVLPDLLATYYENQEYELVCYLAETHGKEFPHCEFYGMMSLMELGYYERAFRLCQMHRGDWFQQTKQMQIYWKHVILFALYFRELDITEYYMEVLDAYYDFDLVQLVEFLAEHREADPSNVQVFQAVAARYPIIGAVWGMHRGQKKRGLLGFEQMQWNIWDKENSLLANGNALGIEKLFSGDGIEVFSYKPKLVAASMHIIRDKDTVLLFDCGCELAGGEPKRIPVKPILEQLGIKQIDAVFVSHAHMDHYGSLNELRHCGTYMSKETYQLIRYLSPDTYLGKAKAIDDYAFVALNGVEVRFVPNGHIRGSVLFDINWKNQKRIVYTGDFSIEDQKTVKGLRVKDLLEWDAKRIDLLITETTYGNKKEMLNQQQYEKIFLSLCEKHIKYGNKIFIPSFAIGRAQEVVLLLAELVKEHGWRILVDGMASNVTDFYQNLMGEGQKIWNKNITACHTALGYQERMEHYEIILASSGMMKPGSTSAMYAENLMNRQDVCVMKVGFIHESEHLLQSIRNRRNQNLHFVDLSLSAHAGYQDLVHMIEQLSPNHVLYVHGPGIM